MLVTRRAVAAYTVMFARSLLPAHAGESPETLAVNEVYTWTAATRALSSDGVRLDVPVMLREELERGSDQFRKSFGSAERFGLDEGDVPSRGFCAPLGIYLLPQTESRSQFDAALLLSEVVVEALIADVVPGFSPTGLPAILLVLSDVVALHERSPLPSYVLVPMDRLVVADRVFCAATGLGVERYRPKHGSRIIVLGPWSDNAVVPVGPGFQGLLAVVDEEGGGLTWAAGFGPPTRSDVLRRVEEAVAEDLFRLTEHLYGLAPGSSERVRFGDEWVQQLIDTGCRVVTAEEQVDGAFRLARTCEGSAHKIVP